MTKSRSSKEYEDGVKLFLKFVINNDVDLNMISSPCTKSVHVHSPVLVLTIEL